MVALRLFVRVAVELFEHFRHKHDDSYLSGNGDNEREFIARLLRDAELGESADGGEDQDHQCGSGSERRGEEAQTEQCVIPERSREQSGKEGTRSRGVLKPTQPMDRMTAGT
jgi:hypothetical protein